ncbi:MULTISPECIES: MlaD family protein [unclassified Sulfurospirillum]|uniref:MlaD family protein n=1 Tax=unclassified Sulfurospirillum TaxID=2618290 RepID=UPI0005062370|nr:MULTISPECIES: MlaD family protein [unclassified Sulfurospirillum]KFL33431.1 organic solvent ABC transporter substrate-binding protein [Sulfurospirillum sp. SCADC]
MENRFSYILVGAFVFVLLIGGVLSILWLGHYSDEGTFKFYKVATKESVSGLNEKAPVKLRGVQIGEVRTITINPKNAEEVLVTIRVQDDAPIKEDTYAVIEAQGITGLSFIQLQGGANEAKELKTSGKVEEYGIIYSRPSTFSRLDKTITSLSTKAEMIFERAERIMSEKNVKNLEIIIENSAKIAESTSKTMANIEAHNKEINQLLTEATAAVKAVKDMSYSFSTAVDTTGVSMMNNVSKASQSITNVMGGLNQKLEKGSFDVDILFRENLMPLHQTLQELQVLLNETQGFVSNLKDSPSDLLFKEETIQPAPNER